MNLLEAIVNIHGRRNLAIREFYRSRNRANNMGEALELFIHDAFAGTFDNADIGQVNEIHNRVFSYMGNQNNPPDAMLRNGDAIEIKKIESYGSSLALNSSYPKNKLFYNSPMITRECRNCETWQEKDIIYAVGVVNDNNIQALSFVYGEDYAASFEIYERIKQTIKNGVVEIPNVEFGETKELGRVNRVDPLGITYLRIRGMWGIKNPFEVFKYVAESSFFAIVNTNKYNTFPQESRNLIETTNGIDVRHCRIKDPNNPAVLKNSMLIYFRSST